MSGLRTFSCVVVLCGAMANVAIASPSREIGDRVEDFIRGVDREPQAPREPTYDRHFVYDR
ncbi:hypothetical protein HpNP16_07100 [Helicobacter pylori]